MKCVSSLKRFVKAFDLFFSTVQLRYNEELEYKTITGGIFSLAVLTTILVGFAAMILNTFELNTYNTSVERQKHRSPVLTTLNTNQSQSKFMFGVEILPLNLSDSRRYFDILLTHQVLNYGNKIVNDQMPLQECTRQHWKNYSPLEQSFQPLNVGYWLCPPMNLAFDIQGKYSSQRFSQYEIKVRACDNSTDPTRPCHSPQDITTFFNQNRNILYFTVYFINPILNPSRKDYLDFYLQDVNYAIFGPDIGTQNYLLFTDYTIQTDVSIWPFQNIVTDQGALVQNQASKYSFQSNPQNGTFILFLLAKSSNSLTINRATQKLSQVFSFIGGTIGAFLAILFVLKQYTNFSFQIALAYNIFEREKKDEVKVKCSTKKMSQELYEKREQNMMKQPSDEISQMVAKKQKQVEQINFTYYFSFAFYKICKFFGKRIEWDEMKYIQRCQGEISKQLDIKNLLSRLIFLQFCMTYMLEDYQLQGLQLKRPRTAQEIKKVRQRCQSIACTLQEEQQQQKEPLNDLKSNKQIDGIMNDKIIQESADQTNKPCVILMPANKPQNMVNLNDNESPDLKGVLNMNKFESMQSEKQQSANDLQNQVRNIFNYEAKQKQLLQKLRANAKRGNHLSIKIWKKLTQNNHKDIKNE